MRRSILCLGVLAAPLLAAAPLCAQQEGEARTNERASGWATGGSLGYAAAGDAGTTVLAAHSTRLSPRRVGADFWIGAMPQWSLLWARAGAALAIPVSRSAYMLPSGGATLVAGTSIGGVWFGANLGAALHAPLSDAARVRAAITWNRIRGVSVAVAEIGLVGFR